MTMTCDETRDLIPGFVLGILNEAEAAGIRAHLATCDEPHPEVAELGGTVAYLPESLEPIEPPVSLRARLLDAAAAQRPSVGHATEPRPEVLSPIPFPIAVEHPSRAAAKSFLPTRWLQIAAVLAVVALGAWNLQLQARLTAVEGNVAAAQAYRAGVAAVLDAAGRPGAVAGFLAPTDASGSGNGVAAAVDGTVLIAMQDLAPTTGSQVYEAWAIVGAGSPVPIGDFRVGGSGTGVLRATNAVAPSGATLALTLEPGPGATTPTAPIVSVGSIVGG